MCSAYVVKLFYLKKLRNLMFCFVLVLTFSKKIKKKKIIFDFHLGNVPGFNQIFKDNNIDVNPCFLILSRIFRKGK